MVKVAQRAGIGRKMMKPHTLATVSAVSAMLKTAPQAQQPTMKPQQTAQPHGQTSKLQVPQQLAGMVMTNVIPVTTLVTKQPLSHHKQLAKLADITVPQKLKTA